MKFLNEKNKYTKNIIIENFKMSLSEIIELNANTYGFDNNIKLKNIRKLFSNRNINENDEFIKKFVSFILRNNFDSKEIGKLFIFENNIGQKDVLKKALISYLKMNSSTLLFQNGNEKYESIMKDGSLKIRKTVTTTTIVRIPRGVYERKYWNSFGLSDTDIKKNTMNNSENIDLDIIRKVEDDEKYDIIDNELENNKKSQSTLICKHCKGKHLVIQCPNRDQYFTTPKKYENNKRNGSVITIKVSNLHDGIEESDIRSLFSNYGKIRNVIMKMGQYKRKYESDIFYYCYVVFFGVKNIDELMKETNNMKFMNTIIEVQLRT